MYVNQTSIGLNVSTYSEREVTGSIYLLFQIFVLTDKDLEPLLCKNPL